LHTREKCSPDRGGLTFAEDIGGHKPVEKVVGAGTISGVDMSSYMLVSSGRQSIETVLKTARSGVLVVASVEGLRSRGSGTLMSRGSPLSALYIETYECLYQIGMSVFERGK